MRRWVERIIGFLVIAIPAAWVSTEFDPIKDWVFEPTYIRWSMDDNQRERTQTFVVHNSGKIAAELRVHYHALPEMAVSDFSASTFKDGPYNSFAETLSHSDTTKLDEPFLRRLMDPHFPSPDLRVLETALRRSIRRKVDERLPEMHQKWLKVCQQADCSKEEAFEAWEGPVNILRTTAISNWNSTTGWQVHFGDGYVSPAAEVHFVRKLEPQSTSYLALRFGPEKIDKPDIQSPHRPGIQVDAEDIDAGTLVAAFRYRRWQTITLLSILIAIAVAPFFRSKSLETRPTHELVNLALEADRRDPPEAEKIWNMVYDNLREKLGKEFEAERGYAGRPGVRMPEVRIFNYVRNCLRIDYGINDQQYRNSQELDSYIGGCLEVFAGI